MHEFIAIEAQKCRKLNYSPYVQNNFFFKTKSIYRYIFTDVISLKFDILYKKCVAIMSIAYIGKRIAMTKNKNITVQFKFNSN